MRKRQKIFLLVSIVALLICSSISIFAALPSGDQTNGSSTSVLYTEYDCRLLMEGLLAQAELQLPMQSILDCFILTVSRQNNDFIYYLYCNYPNRQVSDSFVPSFYKSDQSPGVGYGGYVISPVNGVILVKRAVSVTSSGGFGVKVLDFYLNNVITGLGRGAQFESTEVVLAYRNGSGDVVTFGSDGVYGYSTSGAYQSVVAPMRDMAQSWINARNVKRDGLPDSEMCTISPDVESSIYQSGYNAGNEAGYNNGYKIGYDYASQKIGPEQYSIGHAEGYSQGHSEGFSEGYETGYRYGAINNPQGTPVTLNISSIISSITSSVGSFLTSAFDIEIFGINIAGLLSVLILVAFVLIIVHVSKGG